MPSLREPEGASPRAARREKDLARRRSDIVSHGAEVFAERGYDGAQVSEIAARAEVSLASIYGFFHGKDELYQAVIREVSERIRERVEVAVQGIEDPVERLLALPEALCRCFEEDRHLLQLYVRDTHALPWKVREAMGEEGTQLFREFTAFVAEMAREAARAGSLHRVSADVLALCLLGGVATAALRTIEDEPDRSLLALASELRALFVQLFRPGAEA